MSQRADEWMILDGPLNMETVPAWFAAGTQRLANADLWVDFSHVVSVDSAAVGMLLPPVIEKAP